MKHEMDNLKKREINFIVAIISPIITVAFTVGMYITTLNNYGQRIEAIEAEHKNQRETFIHIQVQLAEIQKDILYIKEKLK